MKMNRKVIKGVLLIWILVLYVSCIDQFPELPAETQTGEGTFGCLVNNELVFSLPKRDTGAKYNPSAGQLQIRAYCQYGQQFVFFINEPYNKQTIVPIDTIRFLLPNSTKWMQAAQTGSIHLTRIDDLYNKSLETCIVSGTFSFDLNEDEKTPIHVTKGRFDLSLNTY